MTFIEQWLRSDIKSINAYHVPDSKNLLKLDAMESPFGVPSDLKEDFLITLIKQKSIDTQMLPLLSSRILLETLWRYQMSLKSFLVMVQMN